MFAEIAKKFLQNLQKMQDKVSKSIYLYFYIVMKGVSCIMATISIRIEEEEKEALQKYANDNDLSVSQVVRKAIKEFLRMNEIADKFIEISNYPN